jgi:polar amino acid transport system substrate-binding protein
MRLLFILFVLLSSIYASNQESKKNLENVTLQLHWKYQFEFAGFIAAKEKGFYKDVGLDVTLKEYQNGMDISDEVLSGRANYGIYNSQLLIEYLKGKPIKLLASFFKRAALVLVTQPEIKTPKDLVGKTIMTTTKEDFILNFKPFLEKYGVSVDDLKLVPNTY